MTFRNAAYALCRALSRATSGGPYLKPSSHGACAADIRSVLSLICKTLQIFVRLPRPGVGLVGRHLPGDHRGLERVMRRIELFSDPIFLHNDDPCSGPGAGQQSNAAQGVNLKE